MVGYYNSNPEDEDTSVDLDKVSDADVLNDTSPMPFGKHKDSCMEDVPASYLHWFWTECRANNPNSQKVRDYIKRNLSALKMEYQDGVWTRPSQLDT